MAMKQLGMSQQTSLDPEKMNRRSGLSENKERTRVRMPTIQYTAIAT